MPLAVSWRVAASAQPRLAAGLAGEGWRTVESCQGSSGRVTAANCWSAKPPTPTAWEGRRRSSTARRWARQGGVHGGAVGGGEFIGGQVGAGGGHPHEGAVVEDKVIGKEGGGGAEVLLHQAPETAAADLGAGAGEALDAAFGVLDGRLADGGGDAQPVAHGSDLAEGHAGLRHAKGAGIHAEENDAFGGGAVTVEVGTMGVPGVGEGVVGAGDGRGEGEGGNGVAEGGGEGDEGGGRG